jgi:RNA polymerase sigma-70 factor (ECF subfamily)
MEGDMDTIPDDIREATRSAWPRYLDLVVPFRPDLYRYCRSLTGNVWDAEDLVQDTLLRSFAALGSASVDNVRGYLVRTASNLFVDGQRRRRVEQEMLASEAALAAPMTQNPSDAAGRRNAAAVLIAYLAPKERAAVVLKEVFDMSLNDIAAMLSTSENAVKAALHRGRDKLRNHTTLRPRAASPALIEKFVTCLDASDLDGLLALMLDTASITMPPALIENGRAEFSRKGSWLWHAVNVHPDLPPEMRPPKWVNRVVDFHGETVVLGLMPPSHGGTLQGINRFEEEDGKIARIRSYCFTPEVAAEVAQELGLGVGWIPYRFPMSE